MMPPHGAWPAIGKSGHLGFSDLFDEYPYIDTTCFLPAKVSKHREIDKHFKAFILNVC